MRDAGLPTASEYLRDPGDWGMKQQKEKVAGFIAGPGFKVGMIGVFFVSFDTCTRGDLGA